MRIGNGDGEKDQPQDQHDDIQHEIFLSSAGLADAGPLFTRPGWCYPPVQW
jgi:hypothetical protein